MSHRVVVRYSGGDDACVCVCGHCACRARARQANQVGALARTQIKWVTRRFRGKIVFSMRLMVLFVLFVLLYTRIYIYKNITKVHEHFYQHRARSESKRHKNGKKFKYLAEITARARI